jgi:ubiquinone/menaquinone biosynthesis C-methylase UbiE
MKKIPPRKSRVPGKRNLTGDRPAYGGATVRAPYEGGRRTHQITRTENTHEKTSWGKEASWYSEHLEQGDTYHSMVILPNLERLVDAKKGMRILEIGGGEGFIARALSARGASITVTDISPELIKIGKEKGGGIEYRVSKAEDLSWAQAASCDVVLAVLTLQNMEKIEPVLKEVARVLREGGRFIFVLNHPAFRIPKATAWGFDQERKIQYRRSDAYLSARKEKMDMHPGKKGSHSFTYSFHRSLQDYMKGLRSAGFAITRLEEWISHKTSEKGPRAHAENTARKEFPLFMMIEATHI